ncbi:MAG: patatin-like phospholipase family protein [Candidatus Kryptoniota bacterium]
MRINHVRLLLPVSLLLLCYPALSQTKQTQIGGKFFHYIEQRHPKVALVLSGGGSRGISQIGVLEEFEKAKIPIDLIVGTSMGSIIGGLYACGYDADQLDSIAHKINWNDILTLSDQVRRSDLFLQQKQAEEQSFLVIRLNGLQPVLPSSLISGQKLTTVLTELVLNAPYHAVRSFDELKVPFRAVATDIVTGKRIVISKGDLAQAMRASATVPVVFTPLQTDSMQLVDGGLISNVPVDVAKDAGADVVIAVNTTSPLRPESSIDNPWDALDQVTSIMMQLSNRLQLEKADVVIRPHLGNHFASDFSDIDSMINAGRIAARASIKRIDSLLSKEVAGKYGFSELPPGKSNDTNLPMFDSLLQIDSVSFDGNAVLPDSILVRPFRQSIGKKIFPHEIDSLCEKVMWIYRSHGLGLARITAVSYNYPEHLLKIKTNEGKISDVKVEGNSVAKDYIIRREFPLRTNDIFETGKAIQGIENIYSTNLFSQVLLKTSFLQGTDVIINVTEKSSRLIRFGLRADNERNGQAFLSISDDDLFGSGTRVGLFFAGGSRNRILDGSIGTTRLWNTELTYGFHLFTGFQDVYNFVDTFTGEDQSTWDRVVNGEYRIIRSGYSLSVGTQLKRFGMVSVALSYGWDKIKVINNFAAQPSLRIVDISFSSAVDTRDKSGFPESGILSNAYLTISLKGLNSQTNFSKIFFNYESYSTLFANFTFRQHYMFGFGDVNLPLSRQFSLGGQDLFFGLRQDALRGRQILLASLELRVKLPFKIFFDTYLSGRFDMGDVWAQQQNVILKTLKQGIGASLGFATPVGPAVFSLGKAIYPAREGKIKDRTTPLTFYFRIGVEIPTVNTNN